MEFLGRFLLERAQKSPPDIEEVVAQIILSELSYGRTVFALVARRLGMSARSLQRRLHERGTAYSDNLRSVRLEILQGQLAQHPRVRLGQLADLLGFSDAIAVGRFMRKASASGEAFKAESTLDAVFTESQKVAPR